MTEGHSATDQWPALSLGTMMTSEPGRLAGTMSESVILPYLGSLTLSPVEPAKVTWISCCHWGYGFVWIRAAAKGHVWVYVPTVANHQQQCQYQESVPPYRAMLDSESLTATRTSPISIASTASWGHCDFQTCAATKGHVLVHGLTTARVYVDVHDPWYY